MNKWVLIPILSIFLIGILSLGIFADISGVFQNQDSAMTISNINLSAEKYPSSIVSLTMTADALFHEDIESISMKGKVYMSDGSYKGVDFNGNPKNGVKSQMYKLKYSDGGLYLNQGDLDNIDYIELTITTVSKEGASEKITFNITSNKQIVSNNSAIDDNSQNESDIFNILGLFDSWQSSDSFNSNSNIKNSSNPSYSSGFDGSGGFESSSKISKSQARNIAQNALEESETTLRNQYCDNSMQAWVFDVYNNGKLVDKIGVDNSGNTFRV